MSFSITHAIRGFFNKLPLTVFAKEIERAIGRVIGQRIRKGGRDDHGAGAYLMRKNISRAHTSSIRKLQRADRIAHGIRHLYDRDTGPAEIRRRMRVEKQNAREITLQWNTRSQRAQIKRRYT